MMKINVQTYTTDTVLQPQTNLLPPTSPAEPLIEKTSSAVTENISIVGIPTMLETTTDRLVSMTQKSLSESRDPRIQILKKLEEEEQRSKLLQQQQYYLDEKKKRYVTAKASTSTENLQHHQQNPVNSDKEHENNKSSSSSSEQDLSPFMQGKKDSYIPTHHRSSSYLLS